jgi:hypothetical protein
MAAPFFVSGSAEDRNPQGLSASRGKADHAEKVPALPVLVVLAP